MELSNDTINALQKKIFQWYEKNKRSFPWRNTTNPYYVHVSEIMLQQTQTKRVIPYYNTFIAQYPTLDDLAQAPNKDLLLLWQGLGYNNRVLRLKESAKQILQYHNGIYPRDRNSLLKLSGIGRYTSSAILAFAFNIETAVVDTNIRRLLIYELNLDEATNYKTLEEIAYLLCPKGNAREWNNALMDYSNVITTPSLTGISSLGKQGAFKGSTREVRSKIIKELLENKTLTKQKLTKRFPEHNISKILDSLEKDLMIIQNKYRIYLKEH